MVNAKQEKLIPPKKFSFGSKLKKAAPKPGGEAKVQTRDVKSTEKGAAVGLVDMNSKVIAEKQGAKLEMRVGGLLQPVHPVNYSACSPVKSEVKICTCQALWSVRSDCLVLPVRYT